MDGHCKISVCLATYNGEKYVIEQLSTILSQLSKADEIVISDDGSTDSTLNIIKALNDDRIKVFKNKSNHGFVGNFENALTHATGDYIFLSDQDDIWLKNKVSTILPLFKDYDLIVHDAEIVDGNGLSLNKNYYSTLHSGRGFLANLYKSRFLGCCMAFTKDVKEFCLPIPNNIVAHDYWIGMYSLLNFKVCFIDDILLKYRRHGNNASPSSEKSSNSFFYKLFTKRLILIWNIMKRSSNKYIKNCSHLSLHT